MKAFIIVSILSVLFLSAVIASAANFSPTPLVLSVPEVIQYNFDGSNLTIPFTVAGTPAAIWLVINTRGQAANIRNVRNGYLGWHYVNKIDTTVYVSNRFEKARGSNQITWDGRNENGNLVTPGEYSYYLWGYDDQTSRIQATQFVMIGFDWEAQFTQVIEKGTNGLPLAKPILFGSNPWWFSGTTYGRYPHGTTFKWELGGDPQDENLLQTTWMQIFTENPWDCGFSYGGPCLNPTDYSIFYNCVVDFVWLADTFMKWRFVPNGVAVQDGNWLGWDEVTLEDKGCAIGVWSQKPSVYTDGNYIYGQSPGLWQQEEEWNKLRCVSFDGELVFDKMMHDWYMPDDYNPQELINGAFHLMYSRVPYHWFLLSYTSCLHQMIDTTRLVADPDDESDMVIFENRNGDYFMDSAYAPNVSPAWYCLADDQTTSMRRESIAIDRNGFNIIGTGYLGLTSFGVSTQDGTGIGYMSFADDTVSDDRNLKGGGQLCDSGSAYDGLYYCGALTGTAGWTDPEMASTWFIASDSAGGIISSGQPLSSLNLTSPNGGETWFTGSTQTITWTSSNVGAVNIEYSSNGGSSWTTITSSYTASWGSYTWTVPGIQSSNCRVRITDTSYYVSDASDASFTISGMPSITVTSPNGGENYFAGFIYTITWTSSNVSNVRIEYSSNNGSSWNVITASISAAYDSYNWTVPSVTTSNYLIRISDVTYPDVRDQSNSRFTVSATPSITVTSPNGGETWFSGSTYTITWTSANVSYVKIEYSTNNGSSWNAITASISAATGSYSWTVPTVMTSNYLVRISDSTNQNVNDRSNSRFTVSAAPIITVTSPNGGESWIAGSSNNITWTSSGVTNVKLEYSTNNGTSWTRIIASTSAAAWSYSWTVPDVSSSNCLVRITDTANDSITDQCNSTFNIASQALIRGDFNNDGAVSLGDLVLLLNQWGMTSTSPSWNGIFDLNNNSSIDLADLAIFASIWTGKENVPISENADFVLDTDLSTPGYQGLNQITNIGGYQRIGCALYVMDADNIKGFTVKFDWDGSKAVFNSSSSATIYDDELTINGISVVTAEETNILGSRIFELGEINAPGHYETSYSTMENITSTQSQGLLYFAVFRTVDSFTPADSLSIKASVTIADNNGSEWSIGSRYFSVNTKSIALTSPNGGENWIAGSSHDITWTSLGVTNVKLEYSTNGGSSWTQIVASTSASSGSYSWTIPNVSSSNCRVKITDTDDATITDGSNETFTIIVQSTITVTSPNGGESLTASTSHNITWTNSGVTNVKLEYTTDNGENWIEIVASTSASSGSYSWTVPDVSSSNCLVRITDTANATLTDVSNGTFTITLQSTIIVTSPNGGESLTAGSSRNITWTSSGVTNVKLEYTIDNGTNWTEIVASTSAAAGSYSWTVPDVSSSNCLVRITDTANGAITDQSESVFTIVQAGSVTLTSPSGGESLTASTSQNITWTSSGVTNVKLEYTTDNGTNWNTIIDSTAASAGSYAWTVPNTPSAQCLVRVSDAANPTANDVSDGVFTVAAPPDGINVALGNTATDLTLTDGDTTSSFRFTGDPLSQTVMVDLGEIYRINSVMVYTGGKDPNEREQTSMRGYSVELSMDNYRWEEVGIINEIGITNTSDGGYDYSRVNFPDEWARYVRIKVTSVRITAPCIGEIMVFGIGTSIAQITVTSPNGSGTWTAGTSRNITWTSSNVTNIKLEYTTDNGTNWIEIVASTSAAAGSYSWTVPDVSSSNCLVRITDIVNATVTDQSDAPFTIINPSITVTTPNGGESLTAGIVHNITWLHVDVNNIKIEYSSDNGSSWNTVIESTDASTGSFSWTVPDIESSTCLVRITDATDENIHDVSENTFSIVQAPFIRVVSPAGGENWRDGTDQSISWTCRNVDEVTIAYTTDSGTIWHTIAENVDASLGTYTWTVPDEPSSQCKIKIHDTADPAIYGETEGVFSIVSGDYIMVISPVAGDRWTVSTEKEIKWEFSGIENVKIELSLDDGVTWEIVAESEPALTGTYRWQLPDTPSNRCRIRISDVSHPEITHTSNQFEIIRPEILIQHMPVVTGNELEALHFNVTITSTSDIDSVFLYYRKTGGVAFDTRKEMLPSGGGEYTYTLESGYFVAPGLEYYITARDVNGIEVRMPEDVGYYSVNTLVQGMKSRYKTVGGTIQNAYRMISIPLALTVTSIVYQMEGKLPQGTSGTNWRMFRFPPGSDNPQEYPDIEGFKPGIAFWLITDSDYYLETPEGTTVPTDSPFMIELQSGWNDIANPWMFDISWDDINNPANAVLSELYTYEGEWSDPTDPPLIMNPWKGYTVRNMESSSRVIFLQPNPAQTGKEVADTKELWRLTLTAHAGEARDVANHLGVSEGAEIEWDIHDHVEPSPVGEYVTVTFPHRDWEKYPYDYTVDFRPPENTLAWEFAVRTNIPGETVAVHLLETEKLPAGYSFRIIDMDMGREISRGTTSFGFVSGNDLSERHFRLVVTNSQESEDEYTSRPEQFISARCFPNPFNPQTTIQYEISHAASIAITVYNMVGQEVAVYSPGHKETGIHEVVFDARNLTSGIYFYRVDAGYGRVTGKMLFMK